MHTKVTTTAATDVPADYMATQGSGTAGTGNTVPVIVFHGDRDTTTAPVNAEKIFAAGLSVLSQREPAVDRPAVVTIRADAGVRPYTRSASAPNLSRRRSGGPVDPAGSTTPVDTSRQSIRAATRPVVGRPGVCSGVNVRLFTRHHQRAANDLGRPAGSSVPGEVLEFAPVRPSPSTA